MELKDRPKLNVPKSLLELAFDCITVSLFLLGIIYFILVWPSLPDQVPAHYNAVGEVDRWGSKWEMIIFPLISAILWIGITVLEKYPHVYNYPTLTKDNVQAQYVNARQMLNIVKNIVTLLFIYILWNDIQVSLGYAENFGAWFMPFFLTALFVPIIYFVIRSFRL